jgi:uncharacterized protein
VEDQIQSFLTIFTSIVWEAFPFVVLGALIAGILEEVVPQQAIARIVPKSKILAIFLGGGLGLIFPMCECGIVPVMRRLLRKGLPLGTCIAYMLAGPIINVIVIASTWVAFQNHGVAPQMVLFRVGFGFIIACTTAYIIDLMYRKHGDSLLTPLAIPQKRETPSAGEVHPAEFRAGQYRPLSKRIGNIAETALHDFTDIMVFLMLGAVLAGLAKMQLTPDQIRDLSTTYPALAILAMMGLAIVLCLCSEADAFVAASFTTLHPSAKLSFLVLGPMFDLKLLLMFTRVFRRKLIIALVISVIVQTFLYMLLVHFIWEQMGWPISTGVVSPSQID